MNSNSHRIGAALAITSFSAYVEQQRGNASLKPITHGTLASLCGTLPDLIEPACHPNHRQFFHSWTCVLLMGTALYRVYKWQPENNVQTVIKTLALIVGGSYLVHLAMDSTTPKSLPLI